jgi:hypothetical protein
MARVIIGQFGYSSEPSTAEWETELAISYIKKGVKD